MAKSYYENAQLDDIILRYKDMVYRIAVLRTKNRSDADDVFQEVFLRLVRHVEDIESEAHLKAWLIRVTVNCCNSFHTDPFRKRTVFYDDALKKPVDGPSAEDDTPPGMSVTDVYPVEESDVVAAVRALPEGYRDVVYLFYFERLSIREIAGALHISEGAVKTRLSRARDTLQERLKDIEL